MKQVALRASGRPTEVSSRRSLRRGGHIDQRIETYCDEHGPRAPLPRSILRCSPPSLATRPATGRLPTKERDSGLAETHAARAVALLRQAVAAGYKDVAHMKKDPDLDALRAQPDFQKLVEELERKQGRAVPLWW